MKRILSALLMAGAALIAATSQVQAQQSVQVQVVAACSAQSWPLNVTRPLTQKQNGDLCVSGGGGGGSSGIIAIAALPTLSAGAQTWQGSLAGAGYVQPVFGSTAGGGTQVDATHGLPVNIVAGGGAGGTSSNFGAAFPTAGTAIGVKVGANMVNLAGDAQSGVLVAGEGTAGSAVGGVVTVQGVASMTPLLVTPAANSSVNISQVNGTTILVNTGVTGTGSPRETVAQDTSTVAGAAPLTTGIYVTGPSAAALATSAKQDTINTSIGTLVTDAHFQNVIGTKNAGTAAANSLLGGLVYNSSPLTLTNTQQASLQGDANGYLKVNVVAGSTGNAAASATGSAVPASADYLGLNIGGTLRGQTGVNPTGSVFAAQVDLTSYNGASLSAAGLPVTQAGATATTTTMQSGATANGNGTVLVTTGMSSAILTVNCSSCSGGTTVNFEGTQDSSNYFPLDAKQLGSISQTANSTTTSGVTGWQIHVAGLTNIRARISAYSAGTITVTGQTVATDYSAPTVNVVGGALDGAAITGALYNTISAVGQSTLTACTTSTQCFLSMDTANRALRVQLMPGTLTGSSIDVYEVAASDNHRVIKNGAGTLRSSAYTNNSATLAYLRYYNAGTGFNGCNSATGLIFEIGIPANTAIAGDNPSMPTNGIAFGTGLSMCVTSGFGNTNTGNAVASAISINTGYD